MFPKLKCRNSRVCRKGKEISTFLVNLMIGNNILQGMYYIKFEVTFNPQLLPRLCNQIYPMTKNFVKISGLCAR